MDFLAILLRHEAAVYTKGWIVTIAGFLIVIIALFILSTIFRGVAAYFTKKDAERTETGGRDGKALNDAKRVKAENGKETEKLSASHTQRSTPKGEIPAEVLTAIGMALYLSTNLHDEESNVITIERRQTSWNDKNYGVRHWNH